VLCGAASTGELEREGDGAGDLVWEVEGGEGSLFREEWRLYIGGRGSTGRVDLRREDGRCRLWREEGAALAGAAGCGVLWRASGAMGEAEMVWFRGGQGWLWGGVRGGSPLFLRVSRSWVGAGKLGIDKGVSMAWLQGLGRTRTASAQ
jgi:hypothetical protein